MKKKIISLQPMLFKCYDICYGTVTQSNSEGLFVSLDGGAYGFVMMANIPTNPDKYPTNGHFKFMVIGFRNGGLLELIPRDFDGPSYPAIVRTVTDRGLILEIPDLPEFPENTLVPYCPPGGVEKRWAVQTPGQKVHCHVWKTYNGWFVSGLTRTNRNLGYINDFNPEIAKTAVAKGSERERNGIRVGKIYIVQKLPTKALLDGEPVSLEIPEGINPGEFSTLEVVITYIPSSRHKKISARVISVLEKNQVTI